MQVDWLTIAAQIANFLVLVWLLQRFLYRPIQNAMAEREARIEQRLSEARSARESAENEAERLRRTQEELRAEREDILDDARRDAEDLRRELEEDVREDIETKRRAWRSHLEDEQEAFAISLRKRAGHQVVDIAAQVVRDFAETDLAGHVAGTFAHRIEALDSDSRGKLTDAAARSSGPGLVESGMTLDSNARRQITRAIHDCLSTDMDIDYVENEEVLLGVRVTIGEQTVEWSAARYLHALDTTLEEVLEGSLPHVPARSDLRRDAP